MRATILLLPRTCSWRGTNPPTAVSKLPHIHLRANRQVHRVKITPWGAVRLIDSNTNMATALRILCEKFVSFINVRIYLKGGL